MPGFNGTGPNGEGPMTGGGRGMCNPNNTGRGQGMFNGRGGAGFGRGRGGFGRGFGRGFGFNQGFQTQNYNLNRTDNVETEKGYLMQELTNLETMMKGIKTRLEELEKNNENSDNS